MSMPTHRIKIKELYDFISSTQAVNVGINTLEFVKNNKTKIDSHKVSDGSYNVTTSGHSFYFYECELETIEEIKCIIEIPETPFWVFKSDIFKVNKDGYGKYNLFNSRDQLIHRRIEKSKVQEFLDSGTWTICDEPKKVIPWSDEDWKEWFLNDGIAIAVSNKIILKVVSLDLMETNDEFFFGGGDKWHSKTQLIERFTDRHGNKFEKEA